jgi:hypothetical protein
VVTTGIRFLGVKSRYFLAKFHLFRSFRNVESLPHLIELQVSNNFCGTTWNAILLPTCWLQDLFRWNSIFFCFCFLSFIRRQDSIIPTSFVWCQRPQQSPAIFVGRKCVHSLYISVRHTHTHLCSRKCQ